MTPTIDTVPLTLRSHLSSRKEPELGNVSAHITMSGHVDLTLGHPFFSPFHSLCIHSLAYMLFSPTICVCYHAANKNSLFKSNQ
ncbi:hypothetical protein HYPSUDRAFT_43534 [Hypholoma sublateritium FD-334 SS-4]|uniref:Uncharacterized protein n=1 Tax=Hypholoma sublateritium (strain FD-334 SS-4) TaxID=945553 RepID=A0A0D2NUE3_HYPSF|nr:hypothetical protein HYPSUDRAFT_43534 [Hypholoma sublateritium FD-334 SS-4]